MMENYEIVRVSGKPDWKGIGPAIVGNYQWQAKMDIAMEARICHDGEHLYLRMRAWEENIRAEHSEPMSMVCEDSCMEFFLRPEEDDLRYFNFEINPNGIMFIGFGSGKENLVRLAPDAALFNPQTERVDGGWRAEYKIPASFLRVFFPGFALDTGKILRANLYKCGHKTAVPHFITWNKVNSPKPSFHRPEDFGSMVLG